LAGRAPPALFRFFPVFIDGFEGGHPMAETDSKLQTRTPQAQETGGPDWISPFFDLRRRMESLFDDMLTGGAGGALAPSHGRPDWPAVFEGTNGADVRFEVREGEQDIEITAELPGLSPEDVSVEHADGVLTIAGEKSVERNDTDKDKNVRVSERRYGAFRRAFRLPDSAQAEGIEARFKDGVLTITVPKAPESASKTNRIPVNRA
jgi:HSP20 family protein